MGLSENQKDEKPSFPPPLPLETVPEFSAAGTDATIRELVKSQEMLRKLRRVLTETPVEVDIVKGTMIVDEVLRSIFKSVSFVQKMKDKVLKEEEEKSTAGNKLRKVCVNLLKGKKGGGIKKERSKGSPSKIEESNSLEDGYSWRKYGQKDIQFAKFPRSYYRCSYRYERGCRARRQTQQKDDDPSTYYITYLDQHICKDTKLQDHQGFESSTPTQGEEASKQDLLVHEVNGNDDDDDGFYSALLQLPLISTTPPATTTTTTTTHYLSSDTMLSELGDQLTSSFHTSLGLDWIGFQERCLL